MKHFNKTIYNSGKNKNLQIESYKTLEKSYSMCTLQGNVLRYARRNLIWLLLFVFSAASCSQLPARASNSSEPMPSPTNIRLADAGNNDLEKVVALYCRLSREEKFEELKKVISISTDFVAANSDNRDPLADLPSSDGLNRLDYRAISSVLPTLIFEAQFEIIEIKTNSYNERSGEVQVLLRSATLADVKERIIVFHLHTDGKQWKINKRSYPEIDKGIANKDRIL